MNVIELFKCGECDELYHSYSRAAECCVDDEEMEEETE